MCVPGSLCVPHAAHVSPDAVNISSIRVHSTAHARSSRGRNFRVGENSEDNQGQPGRSLPLVRQPVDVNIPYSRRSRERERPNTPGLPAGLHNRALIDNLYGACRLFDYPFSTSPSCAWARTPLARLTLSYALSPSALTLLSAFPSLYPDFPRILAISSHAHRRLASTTSSVHSTCREPTFFSFHVPARLRPWIPGIKYNFM